MLDGVLFMLHNEGGVLPRRPLYCRLVTSSAGPNSAGKAVILHILPNFLLTRNLITFYIRI